MKNQNRLVLLFGTILLAEAASFAQGGQTRSITSADFGGQRPVSNIGAGGGRAKSARKPITYTRVKQNIRLKPRKSGPVIPDTIKLAVKIAEVGITLWKLRPPLRGDSGVKLPVKINDQKTEMWTPVRVTAESPFKVGDRVRFAVESATSGYLYVINAELYADGTLGEPSLLFPDPADQYNEVGPGNPVDVPDQNEQFPYFTISATDQRYAGDLIAVVVTPVPLQFKTDSKNYIKNMDEILDLHLGLDVEIFSRTDKKDAIYSKAEAQASCGSGRRKMEREKPAAAPCGSNARKLTRDEPLPQSIYRVKTFAGKPAVALIHLGPGPQ